MTDFSKTDKISGFGAQAFPLAAEDSTNARLLCMELCIDTETGLANRRIDYIIVSNSKAEAEQRLQRVSSDWRTGYGDIKPGY